MHVDFSCLQRPDPLRPDLEYLIQHQRPAATLNLRASHPRAVRSGAHLSRFHGRGVEFDEVRPYQIGDDVRHMDWRVTARTGDAHIKVFREERERPVFLMLDFRPAMFFATQGALKSVVATECASLMAWAVLKQGDRLGGMIFDSGYQPTVMKASRGRRAVLRLLGAMAQHVLWDTPSVGKHTSLTAVIRQGAKISGTGSMLVIVSDARGLDEASETLMRQLLRHHDIIFISVHDPFEAALPNVGGLPVTDGDKRRFINTRDRAVREKHRCAFAQRRERLSALHRFSGFVWIECTTTDAPLSVLQASLGK